MLDKQDLELIEEVLIRRLNDVESNLGQRMDGVSFNLGTEIKKLKSEMSKGFKQNRKDHNLIIKFFDEEILKIKGRVEKLEQVIHPS